MKATNISKIKRDKMLETINALKSRTADDDVINSLSIIENELTKKKYGLVWEEHEERVDKELKTQIPTFDEIKKYEIKYNDNSYNFLLEGDNLHSLYLLEKTHKNRVDIIYIDPPYNTQNKDFIYNDTLIGLDDGFRHSKWLSFMSRRLSIAQKLLSDKGVIFISIDDNEAAPLKMLCDEIFGDENFISQLVWEKKKKGSFLSNSITNIKEYVMVYCKDIEKFGGLIGQVNYNTETYPCINAGNKREIRKISKGIKSNYKEKNYIVKAGAIISDNTMNIKYLTDLVIEDGVVVKDFEVEGNWRYSSEAMWEYSTNKELYITNALYIRRIVSEPRFKNLKDLLPRVGENPELGYDSPINLDNLFENGWGSNEDADNEMIAIFGTQKLFDYPKPSKLIKKLICSANIRDGIVLDFFAGTGTTGQAVAELNNDFGFKMKYILCTNNDNDICTNITYKRIKKMCNNHNLKYYITSYIPRINTDEENISKNLMVNIKNLIQLENGIEIDDKIVRVILTEEEIDNFTVNEKELNECEKLYISSDILLTSKQNQLFKDYNIELFVIPEYYFEDEIRDVT